VFSTIFKRRIRTNNIGIIPFMGEKEGLAVVADAAFNNGQEYGPP
jgi:hypothetical protein